MLEGGALFFSLHREYNFLGLLCGIRIETHNPLEGAISIIANSQLKVSAVASSSTGAMSYGLGDHGAPLPFISATVNHFAAPV